MKHYVAPRNVSYQEHLRDWVAKADRRFEARALAGAAKMESGGADVEFVIMDAIGDLWLEDSITSKKVEAQLAKFPAAREILVTINSPGGIAAEGMGICNLFRRHPAKVTIDVVGEACSAASIIAMAGDRVIMRPGTWMMVHPAQCFAWGSAAELRKAAQYADTVTAGAVELYQLRTGMDAGKVRELVEAETWMTAQQAVEMKFADEVTDGHVRPGASTSASDEGDDDAQIDVNIHVTTNQRRLVAMQSLRGYGRGRNILG